MSWSSDKIFTFCEEPSGSVVYSKMRSEMKSCDVFHKLILGKYFFIFSKFSVFKNLFYFYFIFENFIFQIVQYAIKTSEMKSSRNVEIKESLRSSGRWFFQKIPIIRKFLVFSKNPYNSKISNFRFLKKWYFFQKYSK